jgi:hypothetical protein
LFVITGWWQTVSPNRNKGLGFGTSWIEKLSSIHADNYFPLSGARNYSTDLFKVLVVVVAVGLIFTTLLGLMMAFRFCKKKGSDNADIVGRYLGSDLPSLLGRRRKEEPEITGDKPIRSPALALLEWFAERGKTTSLQLRARKSSPHRRSLRVNLSRSKCFAR